MVRLLTYRLFNYFSSLKTRAMKKSTFKGGSKVKSGKFGNRKNPHFKSHFKVLESPTKSLSDKKEYKVIQLKNGLTACLISDPTDDEDSDLSDVSDSDSDSSTAQTNDEDDEYTTDTDGETDAPKSGKGSEKGTKLAAAALCIGVGSVSDPKEIPGLAHFLEHMVFMGSEKYPQENDFDSFINKHGGSDNGSTDYEVTTFYFECFERHLNTALDKFSQFFISPLMIRDSMTREREAVDSEFQMAVPSDEFRKEQLLVSLSRNSSPVNSFSWGNLITLKENVTDDRLYEMLHEFRKRHYSAHRMTVAVQARLPIPTLEAYVVKHFSKVPNNGLPPDDFSTCENIFDTRKFRQLYYIKPIKNIRQVDLTFCLPSLIHFYRVKPHVYLSWILGYQGKNSLCSYLKKKVWALSVVVGNDESGAEFNSIYATFKISLVLTKEGFNHLKDVIEAVFSYIHLLKEEGPCERIFKEIQRICEMSFMFEEDETASDNVEDLVENMQYFPSKDYITGESLIFEYDPAVIKMIVDKLVPTNMNVMVASTEVPDNIVYDQAEPWFKTAYKAIEFPADWLESWMKAKTLPEFALPQPNPFLTSDFSILPKEKKIPKYPIKIMESPIIELWYRKDQKFELPLAYYYYYLISPLSVKSAKSACMMEMYGIFITMNLAEEGYDAQLAELEYYISACEKGITIKILGYNQKLDLLIELIGKYLNNVPEFLSEQLFEAVKEKVAKSYFNGFLKPSRLCKDLRLAILQQNHFSLIEKYRVVSEITYEEMRTFSAEFLKNLYIQGLAQGNITSSTALNATNALLSNIKATPLVDDNRPMILLNEIPTGEHCCRLLSFNKENSNSIITNYYQCGTSDIKNTVILELILLLIEEPLFDTLRTKEQLGYKVDCSIRDTYGILGYVVSVNTQVDKFTSTHVDSRIEHFLEKSQSTIKKLSEKKFTHAKKDLIQIKQCVDVDLEDEVYRNWQEIVNCKYQFERLQLEIKAIEGLKIQEVKKFWEEHNLGSKNNTHRKLSLQVVGHAKKETDEVDDATNPVDGKRQRSPNHKLHVVKSNINKKFIEIVEDNMNLTDSTIQYLPNSDEITDNKSINFISDIEKFKSTLKQFKIVTNGE